MLVGTLTIFLIPNVQNNEEKYPLLSNGSVILPCLVLNGAVALVYHPEPFLEVHVHVLGCKGPS